MIKVIMMIKNNTWVWINIVLKRRLLEIIFSILQVYKYFRMLVDIEMKLSPILIKGCWFLRHFDVFMNIRYVRGCGDKIYSSLLKLISHQKKFISFALDVVHRPIFPRQILWNRHHYSTKESWRIWRTLKNFQAY